MKRGKLYRCDYCRTIWYKDLKSMAFAYDESLENEIVDWSNRNLKPSLEFKKNLKHIGDISISKDQMEFPAHVTLNTGFELTHALILLNKNPPAAKNFKIRDWYYLDEIKAIKPSVFAYPHKIARHIRLNPDAFIDIKATSSTTIIRFDASAGVFMPIELAGQEWKLIDSKRNLSLQDVKLIYQAADRGGPDFWAVTPPEKNILILGEIN